MAYSFVATADKSRGGVYVNEETVQTVTHYVHHPTPFNLAHKVVSFTVNDQQELLENELYRASGSECQRLGDHRPQDMVRHVPRRCSFEDGDLH